MNLFVARSSSFSDDWYTYFCKVDSTTYHADVLDSIRVTSFPESIFTRMAIFQVYFVERIVVSKVHCLAAERNFYHECPAIFPGTEGYSGGVVQCSFCLTSAPVSQSQGRIISVGALVSCFSGNRVFDNRQKKVIVPPPSFHLHNWDWWEGKESVYSAER